MSVIIGYVAGCLSSAFGGFALAGGHRGVLRAELEII